MRHAWQMVARFLIILAALFIGQPALADDHDATLQGHWAFRIDEATIFVFTLQEEADGSWAGAWTRPEAIDSNGVIFRDMSGEQTVRPMVTAERDGVVQLTFAGPGGTRRNDVLQFRLLEENRAELNYVGIPGDPYPLIRVNGDTPLGPFDEIRIYDRDNAVIAAEYVEPVEAEPLEPLEDMALAPDEEGADDAEAEEQPRITADFLEGL